METNEVKATPEMANFLNQTPPAAKTAEPAQAEPVVPPVTEPANPPVVEPVKAEPIAAEVTKVEPTEPADKTKPESDKVEPVEPAAAEPQKAWWLEDASPAPSPNPKAEQGGMSVEEKAKTLDSILSRPELKYIVDAVISGEPVQGVVQKLRITDYSKLSPEAIARSFGQMKGWNDEQIQDTINSLETMPVYQKDELLESWQAKLRTHEGGELEKLNLEVAQRREQEQKHEALVQQTLDKELEDHKKFMIGKDWFGAPMNESDAKDFENFVRVEFDFLRENGTYDIKRMFTYWLGAKKIHTIKKINESIGESNGRHETLKEIHRPAESSATPTSLPVTKPVTSKPQGAMETAMKIARGELNPISQ